MRGITTSKFLPALLYTAAFLGMVGVILVQRWESPVQREFPVNEPAPRTVFSPLHFTFVDEDETMRLRRESVAQVLPVFALDVKRRESVLPAIENGIRQPDPSRKIHLEEEEAERVLKVLRAVAERVLAEGVVEDARKKELVESDKSRIESLNLVTKQTQERELKAILSLSEAKDKARLSLEKEGIKAEPLKTVLLGIFASALQANLYDDEDQSKERLRHAAESVAPVMEVVKRGEVITQKGLLVTPREQRRLIQLQKKMAKKEFLNRLLGVGVFVLLGLLATFFYLRKFQPKAQASIRFLLLLFTAIALTLALEKLALQRHGFPPELLPGSLAAILLTILWSPSAGLLASMVTFLFSAPMVEFRVDLLLIILAGALAGTFVSRGIRKRIQFVKVGLAVGLVNVASLTAFLAFQEAGTSEALHMTVLGLGNGFLVTGIAFFLVPVLEHLFNLTTDITLLELSDLNHPLLKRMVVEAPGTYHHSLVVSTLAEAACEAIGANALLARVGCYFHDIGKIARSEYFTENQTPETRGRHEKLTPTMSCLVIMNHVKDGIELAKKYKLKDVIVRFIPEHQGKGVIYYFYKKALDQAAPGEIVNMDDFRYAGPKPQSRETAVALLADSVEASSRSLKEVTPEAIRNLVRKIINEKFIDGQMDECDLTLKDLHKIQKSFIHNLMAIFHTRVKYPNLPQDPCHPDLFEADQIAKFH